MHKKLDGYVLKFLAYLVSSAIARCSTMSTFTHQYPTAHKLHPLRDKCPPSIVLKEIGFGCSSVSYGISKRGGEPDSYR